MAKGSDFLIDKKGIIRGKWMGKSGVVEPSEQFLDVVKALEGKSKAIAGMVGCMPSGGHHVATNNWLALCCVIDGCGTTACCDGIPTAFATVVDGIERPGGPRPRSTPVRAKLQPLSR
jgi:hypothetical protein